jgi:hypothetical protein
MARATGALAGSEQLGFAKQIMRFSQIGKNISTTSTSEPPILGPARRINPYSPNSSVQHPSARSDYNSGATLISGRMVRTHLTHRICENGEADGHAPV